MKPKSTINHITPIGGNIFLDLGFEPDHAKKLHAESSAKIETKLRQVGGIQEALRKQGEST